MKQLSLPMEPNECRFYEGCDAPLCPLNTNLGRSMWFPGEPICHLRKSADWVRKQRKIALLKDIDASRCFTIRMLEHIARVQKGLQGIERGDLAQEKAWLRREGRAKNIRRARPGNTEQAKLSDDF
ncbi:MAG: hypothetical protein HYX87_04320 [Chloroflexi bacterium]|nr:hypothetical protein [Chloroflexota bacterium]